MLSQAGDADGAGGAMRQAEDVLRTGVKRAQRGTALRHIAAARAEMGQPEEALTVLKDVSGSADRTPVLVAIAVAHADAGHAKEALAITEDIGADRYRAAVLAYIGITQVKAGNRVGARATVAKASQAVRIAHSPICAIKPVSSAMSMNLAVDIIPFCGWRQRISASNPEIRSLAASTTG